VEELERRLKIRGTETEESIQTRLNKAVYEISFKHHFKKIVTNDILQNACFETEAIVKEFINV
jgi:guanylate kinase